MFKDMNFRRFSLQYGPLFLSILLSSCANDGSLDLTEEPVEKSVAAEPTSPFAPSLRDEPALQAKLPSRQPRAALFGEAVSQIPEHWFGNVAEHPSPDGGGDPALCAYGAVPQRIGACGWAQSTDALIWGTIESLEWVDQPAVASWNVPDLNDRWREPCAVTEPALDITIKVESVFHGENLPEHLVVRMGPAQVRTLRPRPHRTPNGEVAWTTGDGEGFRIGQEVGFALHYVPEFDLWSLMGEPLFTMDRSDRIVFQEAASDEQCPAFITEGVAGLSLKELRERLSSCTEEEALGKMRRGRVRATWGSPDAPERWIAAICFRHEKDFD